MKKKHTDCKCSCHDAYDFWRTCCDRQMLVCDIREVVWPDSDNADNRGTVTGAELFDVKKGYMQENGTAWVGTINSQEVTIIARGATGLDLYNCLLDDDEVEEVLKPYKYHYKR